VQVRETKGMRTSDAREKRLKGRRMKR